MQCGAAGGGAAVERKILSLPESSHHQTAVSPCGKTTSPVIHQAMSLPKLIAALPSLLTVGVLSGCVAKPSGPGDAYQKVESSCTAAAVAASNFEEAMACTALAQRMRARRGSRREDIPQGAINEAETACMANSVAHGRPRAALACMDWAEVMQRRSLTNGRLPPE